MKLKEARIEKGLSQEELADLAATTQATISLTEQGKAKPQLATRQRIEAVLGQVVDWPEMRLECNESENILDPDEFAEQQIAQVMYRTLVLQQNGDKKRIIKLLRQWIDYFEEEVPAPTAH